MDDYDVLIVGAGLSGINAAYRLQTTLPDVRFAILEARDFIGGTWAFWKYPGARSDSSLAVFRFWWYPWVSGHNFASAADILAYVEEATQAKGIDKHIRFGHRVGAQRWSTAEQMWTLDVTAGTTETTTRPFRARWTPLPGLENFRGEVAHPQFWTDDLSVKGKNVVIVGSGATAITMLPHVAKTAAHTTMLQRSPSYVMGLPSRNGLTTLLRRLLPMRVADAINWGMQMAEESVFIAFLLRFPNVGRRLLRRLTSWQLPAGYPVDVHFNPAYAPFEQRLCLCPDGDFFQALHKPNCEIVTGVIDTITPDVIRAKTKTARTTTAGGETPDTLDTPAEETMEIKADMIVTATGLQVELLNGRQPEIDGESVRLGDRFVWRGTMLEGIPNACFIIGYTLGTWTPGVDVHMQTILGVMQSMRRRGATAATPTVAGGAAQRAQMARLPAMNNSSGYLAAVEDVLPKSSGKYPWISGQTYYEDLWNNWTGSPDDGMAYTVSDKKTV